MRTSIQPSFLQPDLPISPVSATFSDGPQPSAYATPVQTGPYVPPPPSSHAMPAPQATYDFDAAAMAQWYGHHMPVL
jgi:hypothetical protein